MTPNTDAIAWLEQLATEHEEIARDIRRVVARIGGAPEKPKARRNRGGRQPSPHGITALVREVIATSPSPIKRDEVWKQVEPRVVSASSKPKNLLSSTLKQLVDAGVIKPTEDGYVATDTERN